MSEDSAPRGGAPALLAAGSLFAGFVVEQRIAESGTAVVYRARDEALGRAVALKIFAAAGDKERFLRELRAVAAIDNPHVIPVHMAGAANGVLYVVEYLVAGRDLSAIIRADEPLAPGRAAGFVTDLASALDAAHAAGVVHGDVKPANVLVEAVTGRPENVYLTGFAQVRAAQRDNALASPGQFTGTPEFAAPEQIAGQHRGAPADQYALACVAYQMLTAQVPFRRDNPMAVLYAHLFDPPPRVADVRPRLPRAVDPVLAKAMDKQPDRRYSTCGEFAAALREALGAQADAAPESSDLRVPGGAALAPAPSAALLAPPVAFSVPPDATATWSAVVDADRDYYDSVAAAGGPDAAQIDFPAYFPERRVRLTGAEISIGRRSRARGVEPDIDLAGDPGISWRHAVLTVTPEGTWTITDLDSVNGTQVNGREIPVREPVPLQDGDRVNVGAWTVITITSGLAGPAAPWPDQASQPGASQPGASQPSPAWPQQPSGGYGSGAPGPYAFDVRGDPVVSRSGGGDSGPGAPGPGGGSGDQPDGRYLLARCPDAVPVGRPFSLLASVMRTGAGGAARLARFDVPAGGRDVLLVLHAPGLRLLGDQRLTVHVPDSGNSSPVMFELCADAEGPRTISITAWLGGAYLGELLVEVTAGASRGDGRHREFRAEIDAEPNDGAVSLVVRYDPQSRAYRFEFRDEDNPNEVVSRLSFEPRQRIERLVADLERLAAGHGGYSAGQVRSYLVEAGAELWRELVPAGLREQFWERQHRIRQLTILSDKDTVPWELLYPRDPGHDAGFLVQQFPVTRGIFGRRPAARLSLWPARFVLPRGSLPEAEAEISAMRSLLSPAQGTDPVIADLTPLQDLIRAGDFGLLHFACHNRFEPDDDASIKLGGVLFTPRLLTTAVIDQVLARSAPMVFMNACRSAGLAPTYNRLDGWASKFLEAGAGAFIGSLWAVSDGAAREFAEELYARLKTGAPLGGALMEARTRASAHADDPTWLAYSAYGDPRAKVTGS